VFIGTNKEKRVRNGITVQNANEIPFLKLYRILYESLEFAAITPSYAVAL